jgi:hypothetical protein
MVGKNKYIVLIFGEGFILGIKMDFLRVAGFCHKSTQNGWPGGRQKRWNQKQIFAPIFIGQKGGGEGRFSKCIFERGNRKRGNIVGPKGADEQ